MGSFLSGVSMSKNEHKLASFVLNLIPGSQNASIGQVGPRIDFWVVRRLISIKRFGPIEDGLVFKKKGKAQKAQVIRQIEVQIHPDVRNDSAKKPQTQ